VVHAAAPRATVALQGAGSTFVAPIMQGKWIPTYTKLHSNVQISYNPTGSGTGISLWSAGSTDFAASDALLNTTQEAKARTTCNSDVIKLPVTIGAVALIYNLPGVQSGIKLTPDLIVKIFMGQIKEWGDLRIQRLNPGLKLPMRPIFVVHRSDGSGTTFIVTSYLSQVSKTWAGQVGSGSTVNWPTGSGAKGSSGLSAVVAQTQGGIGYVDLAYAIKNKLDYATLQNKAGKYIAPGVVSATAAANSFAGSMPADLQQIIVNSPAENAYPITGYSFMFLCRGLSGDKGHTLVDFATYVVTKGQSDAASLYYAPLPKSVQSKDLAAITKILIH
jgi:phosphate transport system substrate-binding protein